MTKSIQSAWKEYVRTGEGYEILFQSISLYVYRFPLHCRYCSEEDCAEFFLSFYPRIPNLIHHYVEQGKGIERYLRSCLKWHMKTYLKTRSRDTRNRKFAYSQLELMSTGCTVEEAPGIEVREAGGPSYSGRKGSTALEKRQTPPRHDKKARKLLLLTLKAAYDLEDRTIGTIARSIGMHEEVLFHLIEASRTTLRKKEERMEKLQDKRSRLYFRLCTMQDEMDRCTNALTKECLLQRIIRLKDHLKRIQEKISRFSLTPTHQTMAEILGIPKGSIDSTLYYLKKDVEGSS
ncbi:MAG: hypothetical protein Kow009_07450 [Spirochaetales bacterium]